MPSSDKSKPAHHALKKVCLPRAGRLPCLRTATDDRGHDSRLSQDRGRCMDVVGPGEYPSPPLALTVLRNIDGCRRTYMQCTVS